MASIFLLDRLRVVLIVDFLSVLVYNLSQYQKQLNKTIRNLKKIKQNEIRSPFFRKMRSIIEVIKSFVSGGDMRWSKMSIHRTMLIYHVLVSLLALVSVGYLWISSERLKFVEEERSLRAAYLEEKKGLLKLEVDQAVGFIRHMQSQTEKRLKENIKNRVYEAHAIAENIYKQHKNSKSTEEIKKIIKDALRPIRFSNNRGYYFAFDMSGIETLFAVKPEMEGKNMLEVRGGNGEAVVADMLSLVKENGESFYTYTWSKPGSEGYFSKIAFVKVFEPIGWVFGTGEYIQDVEEDIQKECITWISSIRFNKDGYVFVGQYDGLSLSGPQAGKNMLHVKDVNGVKIVQQLIKSARSRGALYIMFYQNLKG